MGGENLVKEDLHYLSLLASDHAIINEYGPTETTVGVTYYRFHSKNAPPLIPIGKPHSYADVFILDGRRQLSPIGVPGELYIGGPAVTRGYLNKPGASKTAFLAANTGSFYEGPLYKTGDIVKRLANDDCIWLGRTDRQVKLNGYRIELSEIEALLQAYDKIIACAVDRVEDKGAFLIAYYTSNSPVTTAELKHYLQFHLPQYAIPQRLLKVPSIVLTPNGKVDFEALSKVQEEVKDDIDETSLSPYVALLRKLWCTVLSKDTINIHTSFFENGGDSLLLLQLFSMLKKEPSLSTLTFSIPLLFTYPSVVSMADYIASKIHDTDNHC